MNISVTEMIDAAADANFIVSSEWLRDLSNRQLDAVSRKAHREPEKFLCWAPEHMRSIEDLDHEISWIKLEREVYPELKP